MEQLVREGKKWISRGASVAIFPEGTRSKDGEIHRFKAGAFTLAKEAGAEILPVVLDGTKTLIKKNLAFNWATGSPSACCLPFRPNGSPRWRRMN